MESNNTEKVLSKSYAAALKGEKQQQLPEPKRELEKIVQIGHASDSVGQFIDGSALSRLPTDDTDTGRANAVVLALQNTKSVLKGGLNTPLHESELGKGVPPTPKVSATPNTVLRKTPDMMRINDEARIGIDSKQKANLKRALAGLPAPKNDFEIVAPEDEGAEDDVKDGEEEEEWAEDASERDEKKAKVDAKRRLKNLATRSQVVQSTTQSPKFSLDGDRKKSFTNLQTRLFHRANNEHVERNSHKMKKCQCGGVRHGASISVLFSKVKKSNGKSFTFDVKLYENLQGKFVRIPEVLKDEFERRCKIETVLKIEKIDVMNGDLHFETVVNDTPVLGHMQTKSGQSHFEKFLRDQGLVANEGGDVFCQIYENLI